MLANDGSQDVGGSLRDALDGIRGGAVLEGGADRDP
jgi:hypothetical protein